MTALVAPCPECGREDASYQHDMIVCSCDAITPVDSRELRRARTTFVALSGLWEGSPDWRDMRATWHDLIMALRAEADAAAGVRPR